MRGAGLTEISSGLECRIEERVGIKGEKTSCGGKTACRHTLLSKVPLRKKDQKVKWQPKIHYIQKSGGRAMVPSKRGNNVGGEFKKAGP